jgi:hypothetical protein
VCIALIYTLLPVPIHIDRKLRDGSWEIQGSILNPRLSMTEVFSGFPQSIHIIAQGLKVDHD